jgi:hypothetical protein
MWRKIKRVYKTENIVCFVCVKKVLSREKRGFDKKRITHNPLFL